MDRESRKTRKIILIKRIFIAFIVISLIISIFWKFRMDLYVNDKYSWYIVMGTKYYFAANYNKSLEFADKAISINPDGIEAYKLKLSNFYAQTSIDTEVVEQNLRIFKEKDRSNNSLDSYYFYMGKLKYMQGSINESKSYFEKSVLLNQSNPYYYIGLGIICIKTDELEKSLYYFNLAINNSRNEKNELSFYGRVNSMGLAHAGKGYALRKINSTKYSNEANEEYRLSYNCRYCPLLITLLVE